MALSILSKLISPSKGVDMLKAGIENIVGEKIEHFEIIYFDEKEEIKFRVWTSKGIIFQPYTGSNKDMIIFAVKNMSKMHLKDGETLDLVKCERNEDGTINLDICITKNGEQIKHQILKHKP